jgi:hypothetical protein
MRSNVANFECNWGATLLTPSGKVRSSTVPFFITQFDFFEIRDASIRMQWLHAWQVRLESSDRVQ